MLYLSDEWIAEADRLVADADAITEELAVRFHVTGGPEGDRSYIVRLGPAPVSVAVGGTANVTFELPWELATAIAQGTQSSQQAVLNGKMIVAGDTAALLGQQKYWQAAQDRLGPLRTKTRYA